AAIYKIACIGSVVTENQNKGLSSKILSDCLEAARAEDCDFALLWTDLYDFYRKIGFELAGAEIAFIIDSDLPEGACAKNRIVQGNKIDPNAFLRVFQKHSVCSVRSVKDVSKFLNIPNSRVFTSWNDKRQMQAYAVEGKGADLQNYIHEWGGDISSLYQLFNTIRKERGQDMNVLMPYHSQNIIRDLTEKGFRSHFGYLGMFKVLNPANTIPKLQKYLNSGLQRTDINLSQVPDGKLKLKTNASSLVFDETELTQLMFGPKVPEVFTNLNSQDYDQICAVLPMPIWIWGWDSV
ncbi:MAG: hypothetical protein AB8E15_12815, partial [Bdellovibrionales bacterium]